MKHLYLVFTFLAFIVFTGCSTEPIDNTSTILGEWTLTSWQIETPIDLNNDDTASSEFSPGCLSDSSLNFIDASNATIFFSSVVTYSTTMENGKLIFMTACSTSDEIVPDLISYTINDNTVVVEIDGEELVLTSNGNTLSMLVPNGFIAKDMDTLQTTVTQDVTYIFTRKN